MDGRDGLLVTPGDIGSLSEALRSLLTDPGRRNTLGAAAAARAHEEFTVQVMAERYETLYVNALSSSRRPAQHSA